MTDCEADSQCCLFSCSWHVIKPHLPDWGIEWNVRLLTLCLPLEEGVDVCLLHILSFGAPEFKLLPFPLFCEYLWKIFFLKMPLNTQNAYKVCQKCILLLQFLWRLLSNEQHIPSEWSLMCSCPSRLPAPYSGLSKQLPPPVLRYLGVFLGGDKGYWKCLCSWLVQRGLMCNTEHFSIQTPGAIL